MAFGFGFNKQKALNAAEKFVQQGKLQNAINEYEKVLKADPKDLTVMNTVGDLYSRLGQTDKALECFKNVGDAYAGQGFTVKAIAMYKKLSKLKPSVDCVLRLAELFTQQGLFNDARAQYLQVAEEFLRSGELEQAVRIFQKTLEMDPENVAMRTRLAEVYIRLNKKKEAWDIFSAAVESLRARGALAAAGEIVQRMLTLDASNSTALLLRGRLAYDSGDLAAAIQNLEKVADIDNQPEGLNTLFQAYIKKGRLGEAGVLATKLITVHNETNAITAYAEALIQANRFEEALKIYELYSDRLLGTDSPKVLETLHGIIGHIRDNTAALETLLNLLKLAGENTHHTEVYELLAHAYVQSGQLAKARDYYQKLTKLEPQNQIHARNYQQVAARLGDGPEGSRLITPEEGANLVEDLEATSPFLEQRYSDEIALQVRAALTDAELFISYNMPAKALEPLHAALPKAPRDLRINQRLASLHTRAGRFAEAAASARTIESVYHDAGYPEEATRYGELASKYENRTTAANTEDITTAPLVTALSPAAELAIAAEKTPYVSSSVATQVEETTTAAPAPKPSGLFWHAPAATTPRPVELQSTKIVAPKPEPEIDISDEWEVEVTDDSKAGTAPKSVAPAIPTVTANREAIAQTVEEIRFYLLNSMVEEAQSGLLKLEKMNADAATLLDIRHEIEAAVAKTKSRTKPAKAFQEIDEVPELDLDAFSSSPSLNDYVSGPGSSIKPQAPSFAQASHQAASTDGLSDLVADLESSLGDSFLPGAEPSKPETKQQPAAAHTSIHAGAATGTAPALTPAASSAFVTQTRSQTPAKPLVAAADAATSVDIADMFSELKEGLEDASAPTEDPETHYNLGVAFREMGLLDEAISELQKVCQAVERGSSFPQLMQAYTWLAQCFLDKGVPEAAVRWYEKALKIPGIDGETRTALHYELGSSYEASQDKTQALTHFMEVYGSNIDYRDVAERIKALKS